MMHGTYIGPHEELTGKGALLQEAGLNEYFAQFDDHDAKLGDVEVWHHWHRFPRASFKLDSETE